MGQAMSSETLSISGGDGHRYWVGLNMKPSHVGGKKTVYKGVLLGSGPRQWEKVVAKSFTNIPGTKESWTHEVNKADITKQLAAKFIQDYSPPCKIRVVIPGIVQMDKVSNVNKWLASKSGGRGLTRDEWLSIEELIPGKVERFCPWNPDHVSNCAESKHLQAFSHFTYKQTNGALLACDFQGICDHKRSTAKYIFTDSIIHSTYKMYGQFDKGEYGITEFFKLHQCTELCRDWPRPTPLTPPPSFDEACLLQCRLTPPPAFENIVFPAQSSEILATDDHHDADEWDIRRRRHATERHRRRAEELPETRVTNHLNIDWHTHRRRSHSQEILFQGSEEEQITCPLPFYGDLPAPQSRDESQPPAYDTVVKAPVTSQRSHSPLTGSQSLGLESSRDTQEAGDLGATARRSPSPRPHSGSLKHLRNGKERSMAYSEMRPAPLRASVTDSALAQITYENRDRSASDSARSSSSLQQRRLQIQPSGREDRSDPVFYCGELEAALPPLIVPSAPPLEDENAFGT